MNNEMLRVLMVPGDGFVSYACADAALDIYQDGRLVLYIAGQQIDFTRADRLYELALLLTYAPVIRVLHDLLAKTAAGDPGLRHPQRRRYRDRKRNRQQ